MTANIHFLSYLAQFFLEREMFQTKVVEKIKTHILCSVTVFLKSCRLWDNVRKSIVEPGRPQMTIWRMLIACWISKATNTHSEYVILIAFPLRYWLHERASMLRYTYIVCLILKSRRSRLLRYRLTGGSKITLASHHKLQVLISIRDFMLTCRYWWRFKTSGSRRRVLW